ncbi:RNA polymerase II elongation factor ELL2-like [Hippopotamus amphibius kiboko]|uniref:RNA polymerase II elongation factor ELL2-like n=1 Tax=Hippopotamus amphibius kiboko TaxID=575201 RepID=UPI0025913619|nr:RNA polymerase II elongation factor ELL2-like [Hippopotamus amphibius kiboko]
MAASGCRAVRDVVGQEGEVAVEEAANIEPMQNHGSVLPRQLPRPAMQATDSSGSYENTVPPSLWFQGRPRLIKTPPYSPPTLHFQLSHVYKDNHQDHTQPTVSGCSPSQPSPLQSMPENMAECTTTNSYLMMQGRKTPVEYTSCNKRKQMRRPRVMKRLPIRRAPRAIPDPVPERKKTTPVNLAYTVRKSHVVNSVHTRPYRDRVIHLLALKNYKKHELLVRLQKDGIASGDNNSLGKILQQVAHLNTQDLSYSLNDYVFKELQRDWPGYSELDRQSLDLVLSRKVGPFQNATGTNHPESSIGSSVDKTSSPSQEQLFNSAVIDYSKKKKVRISHLATKVQSTSHGRWNNTSEKSAVGHPPPSEAAANLSSPLLPTICFPVSNPPQPVYSNCRSCRIAEGPKTQAPYVDSFSQNSRISEHQQCKHTSLPLSSISIQMKCPKLMEKKHLMSDEKFKYKLMEHKAKNQEYNNNIEIMENQTTHGERQGEGTKPNSSGDMKKVCTPSGKTCSTSALLDYVTDYVTIVSSEQRQRYEQEFRVDYEEYKALYAKIQTLCNILTYLNSKRKHLSPDSKEYQDINKRISLEYQKMKEKNPSYCREKRRCQYLYDKLIHIKNLIDNYDQQ